MSSKIVFLMLLLTCGVTAQSSRALQIVPHGFIAVSVRDLDSSSAWYAKTFGLGASTDLPSTERTRTRILMSDEMTVELTQHAAAKSISEYTGDRVPTFLVHGFFKVGVFVRDLDRVGQTLRSRGVAVGVPQSDATLGLRWLLLRDTEGNFIQLVERTASR